jgi:hypothetical protein
MPACNEKRRRIKRGAVALRGGRPNLTDQLTMETFGAVKKLYNFRAVLGGLPRNSLIIQDSCIMVQDLRSLIKASNKHHARGE